MIKREEAAAIAQGYGTKRITIGVLGSHSAEETGISARAFGFRTLVVCQKGRDELYAKYSRHLFDDILVLDRFSDITKIQDRLLKKNTIFIPNRSFSTYVGYDAIENDFLVPMYGNRSLLRSEERTEKKNQYWLLEKAGIRTPRRFSSPSEIDGLAIVKVRQKNRPLERSFFYADSEKQYYERAEELIRKGVIDAKDLGSAVVEEYVLGQKFNANFQGWALKKEFGDFDLVGFDDRKQTNLHGLLGLPAKDQLELDVTIKNEEIGHYGLTMRESQKPLVYRAGEKFRRVCEKEYPPGMIGLFALQGAVAYSDEKSLDFYVFDVSPRIPGCPCVGPTSPEMRRLSLKYAPLLKKYGAEKIETPLDLCMLEIAHAARKGMLGSVVT